MLAIRAIITSPPYLPCESERGQVRQWCLALAASAGRRESGVRLANPRDLGVIKHRCPLHATACKIDFTRYSLDTRIACFTFCSRW